MLTAFNVFACHFDGITVLQMLYSSCVQDTQAGHWIPLSMPSDCELAVSFGALQFSFGLVLWPEFIRDAGSIEILMALTQRNTRYACQIFICFWKVIQA